MGWCARKKMQFFAQFAPLGNNFACFSMLLLDYNHELRENKKSNPATEKGFKKKL